MDVSGRATQEAKAETQSTKQSIANRDEWIAASLRDSQ